MKKILTLIMALILCLSIVGCDKTDKAENAQNNTIPRKVENALNNTIWKISVKTVSTEYEFKDDIIKTHSEVNGMVFGEEKGKYSVTDDCIEIAWDNPDNGRVDELYYSFENGTIKLFSDEAKESEIKKVH